MALTNAQAAAAIRQIADAIVDTVREAGPMGAPGGVMYAALMAHGCTLSQFEQLMAGLVSVGRLTKHDECYRVAGEG